MEIITLEWCKRNEGKCRSLLCESKFLLIPDIEDMYLALIFQGKTPQVYTIEQILSLSDSMTQQFAQILQLPIDEDTRIRILHILDLKGYLDKSSYGFFS